MSDAGALGSEERVRPLSFGKSLALVLGAGLLLRWFYLADVLSKPELGRDFERAVSYYERALEVRRRTPDIYFNLGHAYAQLGNYARAAEAMIRVTDINPRDRAAHTFALEYAKKSRAQR